MTTRTLVFSEDSIREFERALEAARALYEQASDEKDHEQWAAITHEVTMMAIRKFLP